MIGVNYFNLPTLTSEGHLEHFHMWISEVNVDLICSWSI